MQAQKFDLTKPHGVIYGHPEASYEQNGSLYSGDGTILGVTSPTSGKKKVCSVEPDPVDSTFTLPADGVLRSDISIFLTSLLSGGPITQINIKKECEKAGFDWSEVLDASAEMGIYRFKKGALMMWQLSASDGDVQGAE